MEWLVLGIAGVVVYLLAKNRGKPEEEAEEPPPPDELDDEPPPPAEEDRKAPAPERGGGSGLVDRIIKKGREIIEEPPDLEDPIVVAPQPEPAQPGDSPTNPISSKDLHPGFIGYYRITTGDTLSKIAVRLGMEGNEWRAVRDDPENYWAVEQCPNYVKNQYYGGEDGISLVANYGEDPPGDCVAPGYKAKLYKTAPLTGTFPVLHWGG